MYAKPTLVARIGSRADRPLAIHPAAAITKARPTAG